MERIEIEGVSLEERRKYRIGKMKERHLVYAILQEYEGTVVKIQDDKITMHDGIEYSVFMSLLWLRRISQATGCF